MRRTIYDTAQRRPFTIVTSCTVLAADKEGAREFAKELQRDLKNRIGANGAVVIPDTVKIDMEEELEIYEEDFEEEVSISRRVG